MAAISQVYHKTNKNELQKITFSYQENVTATKNANGRVQCGVSVSFLSLNFTKYFTYVVFYVILQLKLLNNFKCS